ncbi:hypothetical protein [Lysinibacillus sp. C5.1]|uniref:hypothetical protein n=1 Tax=Lysinibacillus sp. C5.1 TaxID=2796169 RepID=UPI0030819C6B
MKMLVAHPGFFGPIQHEVIVNQLILHEGVYLALHRPAKVSADDPYSMWIVSDFVSGMGIAKSISSKYAIEKAKKLVSKNKKRMSHLQNQSLKKLMSTFNISVDFELLERIERKCAKRGNTSVRVMDYR